MRSRIASLPHTPIAVLRYVAVPAILACTVFLSSTAGATARSAVPHHRPAHHHHAQHPVLLSARLPDLLTLGISGLVVHPPTPQPKPLPPPPPVVTPPPPPSPPVPVDPVTPDQRAAWSKVAMCEEGGNWQADGSRFSGGLGITRANWAIYGGLAFAPSGAQATEDQQIQVAERIQSYSPDQYGCSSW